MTYDVLDNERHKAVCELRKLPDGYPSYSAFPFAKWYKDLSLALGISALGVSGGELSCARVRDTLIHLLGGDQTPVTLGDPYGISKEGDGGVDAGGRVEAGGGRSDVAADGHMADSAGSQVSEGVAPITAELRELLADVNWVEITDHMRLDHGAILDGDLLDSWHAAVGHACDAIDAVHAQLERDYKVACEVNERQDEQYADMVHKLDRAYEKNRNQRKQLTEVQGALHRRNEGELKARWQKEIDRLERENEELRRQLESLMSDNRPPTVEDVLREFAYEMNENLGMYTGEAIEADEWRDADAKTVEKFAAKLRLAEMEDA